MDRLLAFVREKYTYSIFLQSNPRFSGELAPMVNWNGCFYPDVCLRRGTYFMCQWRMHFPVYYLTAWCALHASVVTTFQSFMSRSEQNGSGDILQCLFYLVMSSAHNTLCRFVLAVSVLWLYENIFYCLCYQCERKIAPAWWYSVSEGMHIFIGLL